MAEEEVGEPPDAGAPKEAEDNPVAASADAMPPRSEESHTDPIATEAAPVVGSDNGVDLQPGNAEASEAGLAEGGVEKPVEKPKRGKPKDPLAPPKPKNAYQKVSSEARVKLKEEKPELATDFKALGLALKEAWEKTPEEEKERLTKEYERDMEIWRPKYAAYKETDHYKKFFEIKQDWIDARARKKLVKKFAKEAPKRPKSGYMLFAAEVREEVLEQVLAAGGTMWDTGKKISEKWSEVAESKKAEYAEQAARMKAQYDVEYAEFKKTDSFKEFMNAKAMLEKKQMLKKLARTKLDEAPKKYPSPYALFRKEVMPTVVGENKGMSCGELGKKVAELWAKVSTEDRARYSEQSEQLKNAYVKQQSCFKTNSKYLSFLEERKRVKAKENKLLNLRDMPMRPKSVFAMFAEERAKDVEPGKGEGRGRSALKKLFAETPSEALKAYEEKEREMKDKYMQDVKAYKDSDKYKGFQTNERKINTEFLNEAMKVMTLKFLSDAPQAPPKTPFAVYLQEKRKNEDAVEEVDAKKSKKETGEMVAKHKEEFNKLDKDTKDEYDAMRKDQVKQWQGKVREYMAKETWQEYIREAKRLKVPVVSLLAQKKSAIKTLKNGIRMAALPERPAEYPSKPPNAYRLFVQRHKHEMEISAMEGQWQKLIEEEKMKYVREASEMQQQYLDQLKEFQTSDSGKAYLKEVRSVQRRRKLQYAKAKFLQDLPKKPPAAYQVFMQSNFAKVKAEFPALKGFELKGKLTERWRNLAEEERRNLEEEANGRMQAYNDSMTEYKKGENWQKFVRAVKTKAKPKAKGKGHPPPVPASMPKRPDNVMRAFVKENAGSGKSLSDLASMFRELPDEEKTRRRQEADESNRKYEQDMLDFRKKPEGRRYYAQIASLKRKKRLDDAKIKYLKDEPKRPMGPFQIFMYAKRPDMARDYPDVRGLGPVTQKITELWKGMEPDQKAEWEAKYKEEEAEYQQKLAEFRKTPEWRKYQSVLNQITASPKGKAKAAPAGPPVPENMPKKPLTPFFIFLKDQKESGANNIKANEAWQALGDEGRKKYADEAKEQNEQYEKDLLQFKKSAEGKKYFRLQAAATKKKKVEQARQKFLGGKDAPEMPKRPQSAYFMFVSEKRGSISSGTTAELSVQVSKMWHELPAEEKEAYERKAKEAKDEFDQAMASYKNSMEYKRYDRAVKSITAKPKPKAALGGGAGRGAGKGRGRGRVAAPANAGAASDSSDVMGSDSDDSSSSDDSDSD